jgi:hypothetical protein
LRLGLSSWSDFGRSRILVLMIIATLGGQLRRCVWALENKLHSLSSSDRLRLAFLWAWLFVIFIIAACVDRTCLRSSAGVNLADARP